MTPLKQRSGTLSIGALAALVGGIVLLGWALDIAALKSVLPGWVSMKPNTAVAFILTGIALLASSALGAQASPILSRLSRFCALFAGLIGLLSLYEYAFDWNPGFDQWLFPEPAGTVGTSHPGRMAPDTALCFMLFAAGWEFARRPRPTTRTLGASLFFGAAMTTLALIEILSYFAPALRTYGWGGLTMMALPTASLFAALGVALLLAANPESVAPSQATEQGDAGTGLKFVLVFAALTIGIIATGTFYYRNYERQIRGEAEQQLNAVAALKVGELEQYRKERLGDAAILNNNPAFAQLVRRFLASQADADAQRQLQVWLGNVQAHYQYDRVSLLDAQGAERLATPAMSDPMCVHLSENLAAVLRSGRVTFFDFHRDAPDQPIRLGVVVPIHDEADSNRPLGVIVLRIDPAIYLYPFLSRWPVPSPTAETLLIRREGNEAVFLNELRFQKNTALTLRISLTNTTMPAVKAALGQEGIVVGHDYRNKPVLAALHAIPDSPWSLVARRDLAEVYAPLRAQLWQVIIIISVLIFGAGAGVALVWRQQRVRFYQEKAETGDALQKSQNLLIQAEKLGKVGGWEFDIETGQQTWTETVYDIHELESTGHPTVEQGINFYTPASRPLIERAVQRAIMQGEPFDLELEIITAKGNLRNVHVIGRAVPEHGKVSGFFQDITRQKKAEAEAQSEQLLSSTIIDSIPGTFYLLDEQGCYRRWNSYQRDEIIGKPEEQIAGMKAIDTIHPEDRALIQARIANVLQDDKEDLVEGRVLLRGGPAFIWMLMTGRRMMIAGRPFLVGTGIDITERKQTEEAQRQFRRAALNMMMDAIEARERTEQMSHTLQASEATFRAVAELSPMSIYVSTGSDQKAIFINDTFYKTFGFSMEDVPTVGHWWIKAIPDEKYRQQVIDQWTYNIEQANKNNADVKGLECICTCKDGSKKSIIWVAKTIGDEFWAFGYDLSERKEREEERRLFTEELARSNVDLQQFAYVASHDLQEPLRMVSSYLQLIERRYKDRLDDDANTFIHYAVDGANRMQALIVGLLEFSRVKTHGQVFAPVEVTSVLQGVCRNLHAQIVESGAMVHYEEMPVIQADEAQIARLFQNLLQNALKFRKEDIPPVIEIRAEKTDAGQVFSVHDNGIGIEQQYFERIFTIFQRLHTREEYPGTGIGLAICKRIVERHGGKIWLESTAAVGTTFYFSIPGDLQ
jgi:hypothetical protein